MNENLKAKIREKKFLKIFILAVAILLVIKVLFNFSSVSGIFTNTMGILQPFVLGFIIAYCINIPISWLEKIIKKAKPKWVQKIARPLSICVNLLALGGAIAFGLMNIIPMIYNNAKQLVEDMPEYINAGLETLKRLPLTDELGLDTWIDEFNVASLGRGLFPSAGEFTDLAAGVFSGVFTVFLTIVSTLYFLAEYNKIKEFCKRFIRAHSPKRQRPIVKYIRLIDFSFRKFLTCQFLDSLILGTMTMVGFTVMKSQYAVTLGLLLGILNIIPYFGSIFGTFVAVFIVWASSGLETAIVVAIMLVIMQQIDGNFINPKIMGTSFKISPVLVIIAITIGGAVGSAMLHNGVLGGVMGMIFAIPVANVIKTVLEEYLKNKEELRVKLGESTEQRNQQKFDEIEKESTQEA